MCFKDLDKYFFDSYTIQWNGECVFGQQNFLQIIYLSSQCCKSYVKVIDSLRP